MHPTPLRHSAWIARCLGRGELAPLAEEDVALLARELGERSHPAGATLFRMGQVPACVLIVRQGAIELSRTLRGRHVVLQILRPGDVAGDIPLFVRMLEPYDARALEDSVVLSIDSIALFGLLERHPRLARRWLVSMAERSADIQMRLVDLLAGGLEAQIASVLIHQAEHGVVRLSQAILADLVGARRTSVNRVLKRLEADGVVRLRYGQVDILDANALFAHSGIPAPPPSRSRELSRGAHHCHQSAASVAVEGNPSSTA